jgi:uncharacterized membrane protein
MRQFAQNGSHSILFCGDDDMHLAALYLAAIIHDAGYDLDYVPSGLDFPPGLDPDAYDLLILSDYPRERFHESQLRALKQSVLNGTALLMIGGWESFSGLNLEYTGTALSDILPVELHKADDRVNYDQGIIVEPAEEAPDIFKKIDWSRPPLIGGYNAFIPKAAAKVCLTGKKLCISRQKDGPGFRICESDIPLCVIGKAGKGKVTALAFDLAPHWIGGMVDWGTERRRIDFDGNFIEVGNKYIEFVHQLLAISLREKVVSEKENE